MQQLDYSALENMPKKKIFGLLSIIGWVIFGTIVGLAFTYEGLYPIVFVTIIGVIALSLYERWSWRKTQRQVVATYALFARANTWQYVPRREIHNKESGSIFLFGHSKKVEHIISGKFMGCDFSTFSYQYTVGSGRSRQDFKVQVVELTLPRVLPHMVIDSLVDHGGYSGSVLPIIFDKSQRLELEGDFYKYFALYAPDKYGISALSVLAPNAMEALMKYAALCDIEIIDNKIFFLWPGHATTSASFKNMLTTVQGVMQKIGKKLEKSDIYAHQSQAALHATQASQGVRLKKEKYAGWITALVIVGYSGIRIGVEVLPGLWSLLIAVVVLLGALAVAVRAMIIQTRKARLREELQQRSF